MRANTDRAPGVQLVTDPYGRKVAFGSPKAAPPSHTFDFLPDDGSERDLIALAGRLNAGVAVQLLLDRTTRQTFVTTVVAGECLTVEVEGTEAWDAYEHPGYYGLLPQL